MGSGDIELEASSIRHCFSKLAYLFIVME